MLVFRLTVNNYGDVPIRTTSPAVGTVYQQEQRTSAVDALEEPGACVLVYLAIHLSPTSLIVGQSVVKMS